MKKLKSFVLLFIFCVVFYLLFTYPFDMQEIITGLILALIIALMSLGRAEVFSGIRVNPKAMVFAVIYFFVFFIELIKSNLNVALRVIKPTLPINPGIVKVHTKLQSKIGRVVLANSITLTPGTLTVETKDDAFYIHWISITGDDIETYTKEIVAKFEKYLEVIYG